jgi:hypothetical protein
VAVAVLSGLAVQPGLLHRNTDATAPVADSYDGFDAKGAEQLRQDQCLMAGVLRQGGPTMFNLAQDALNQSADKLHTAADQEFWNDTPLSKAFDQDRVAYDAKADELGKRREAWEAPLDGLSTPDGFTVTGFHWPPGSPGDGKQDFFEQTGLSQWIGEQ